MMRLSCLQSSLALLLLLLHEIEGGQVQFNPIESLFGNVFVPERRLANATSSRQMDPFAPTPEERAAEREARRQRHRARNSRVKEAMKYIRPDNVELVPDEDLERLSEQHPSLRNLSWGKSSSAAEFADPGDDYDMWQQAYRMLGGFIDCDHHKDQGGGSHDKNENGDGQNGCSRWMLWAAYVDPNYQGGGRDEYFGDDATGVMDCHNPNTEWVLLGVYRQEFYQFIEQISKHLWAIDEYEYVVALAGLAYMTNVDCYYVGTDSSGNYIYAGVEPLPYGKFQMGLYTDNSCLYARDDLGMTFDDFGLTSNVNLKKNGGGDGGGDDGGGYSYAYEWWEDAQEYTFTNLNDVYDSFKYCTSCIDYPTYQDGYVIGDDGMDDDDLINQCWKFYSHDSYNCEADCIALAHSQGTILSVVVGGKMFGTPLSDFYDDVDQSESGAKTTSAASSSKLESKFSRLMANAFVTFSFIVFVSTFLAFAVARRSRYRESRSSKSRRLLDDDDGGRSPRSKRSSRSKSKSREEGDGDGLFRPGSRKSRSKSGSKRKSHRSRSRGGSEREDDYEPPKRSRSKRRNNEGGGEGDDF